MYTGLIVGLALIVIGVGITWYGIRIDTPRPEAAEAPSIPALVLEILGWIVSGLRDAMDSSLSTGKRVQGLGHAIAWIGGLVTIGWLLLTFPALTKTSPTPTPSPSAS